MGGFVRIEEIKSPKWSKTLSKGVRWLKGLENIKCWLSDIFQPRSSTPNNPEWRLPPLIFILIFMFLFYIPFYVKLYMFNSCFFIYKTSRLYFMFLILYIYDYVSLLFPFRTTSILGSDSRIWCGLFMLYFYFFMMLTIYFTCYAFMFKSSTYYF